MAGERTGQWTSYVPRLMKLLAFQTHGYSLNVSLKWCGLIVYFMNTLHKNEFSSFIIIRQTAAPDMVRNTATLKTINDAETGQNVRGNV